MRCDVSWLACVVDELCMPPVRSGAPAKRKEPAARYRTNICAMALSGAAPPAPSSATHCGRLALPPPGPAGRRWKGISRTEASRICRELPSTTFEHSFRSSSRAAYVLCARSYVFWFREERPAHAEWGMRCTYCDLVAQGVSLKAYRANKRVRTQRAPRRRSAMRSPAARASVSANEEPLVSRGRQIRTRTSTGPKGTASVPGSRRQPAAVH